MPDPRFFTVVGPFTLEHLAAVTSAELASDVAPSLLIRDVAPLDHAGPTEISFLDNRKLSMPSPPVRLVPVLSILIWLTGHRPAWRCC